MRWVAIAGVLCGLVGFGTALGALSAAHAERERVSQQESQLTGINQELDKIRKALEELKSGQPRQSELVTGMQARIDGLQRTLTGLGPVAATVAKLQLDVADLKTALAPPPAAPPTVASPTSQPSSQPASARKPESTPRKPEPAKPAKTPKKTPK